MLPVQQSNILIGFVLFVFQDSRLYNFFSHEIDIVFKLLSPADISHRHEQNALAEIEGNIQEKTT